MDISSYFIFHSTIIWSIYLNYVNTETSPQESMSNILQTPLTDAVQRNEYKRQLVEEDFIDEISKKAWDKNMRVWGKRQSYEKRPWNSNMRVWGKRSPPNTKKWDQSMRVWGKRDSLKSEDDKKWSNSMRVWGKRNDDNIYEDKKAWSNNMRTWGKRDPETVDKKAWKDNMRVWGKRNNLLSDHENNLNDVIDIIKDNDNVKLLKEKRWIEYPGDESANSGKRTWRTNTMRVWGKRSSTDN